MPPFEEIDHTADWAFRVRAASRKDLFLEAAQAVYTLAGVRTDSAAEEFRTVRLQADDLEGLFILWLNELLFLMDYEHRILEEICIERLDETALEARGRATRIAAAGKYIKAATYSGLRIERSDDEWQATVVLDV